MHRALDGGVQEKAFLSFDSSANGFLTTHELRSTIKCKRKVCLRECIGVYVCACMLMCKWECQFCLCV